MPLILVIFWMQKLLSAITLFKNVKDHLVVIKFEKRIKKLNSHFWKKSNKGHCFKKTLIISQDR